MPGSAAGDGASWDRIPARGGNRPSHGSEGVLPTDEFRRRHAQNGARGSMPELDAHERRSGFDDLDRRLEGMCDERGRGAQTVEDLDGTFGDVPALVRARVRGDLVDKH